MGLVVDHFLPPYLSFYPYYGIIISPTLHEVIYVSLPYDQVEKRGCHLGNLSAMVPEIPEKGEFNLQFAERGELWV